MTISNAQLARKIAAIAKSAGDDLMALTDLMRFPEGAAADASDRANQLAGHLEAAAKSLRESAAKSEPLDA